MIFNTDKKQSWKSWAMIKLMNFYPTYRRTGGRMIFFSEDGKEVHIRLKLGWGTKNYVGTLFGGSLASAADPIYMIQLLRLLGGNYVVWDKAASIRFLKPGTQTLYMQFLITDDFLDDIKQRVTDEKEFDIDLETQWVDKTGKVYATVVKTLYIADKAYYKNKRKNKKQQVAS
ncbi:MAG: DUF4442 domain-containing protein [Aureispira sp.]|nr:DUF4442 domain-containing protein [Aureispira sp.]